MLTRSVSELQRNMLKLSERIKASDARFSTHQLQELLNKEESSAKQIHLLKKQVHKMKDNNQELNKHELVLHNLHEKGQTQFLICNLPPAGKVTN